MFQEYPKWVTPKDGEAVIVQDKAEEDKVLGKEEPKEEEKRGPGRPRKE